MNSKQRIPSLDGLRAVSISLVIVGHSYSTFRHSTWNDQGFYYLLRRNGHVGVMIFFVLSGYLITHLLLKEWNKRGAIDLKNFYIRRALRIWPAFYAYIAVIGALTIFQILQVSPLKIATAATFTWNYRVLWIDGFDDGSWYLGHFWTLALEEQFYLLWPLIFSAFGPRKSAKIAVSLVVSMPILRVLTYFLWPAARGSLGMMLHCAADFLMIGCLMALWRDHPRFQNVYRWMLSPLALVWSATYLLAISPALAYRWQGAYESTFGLSLELCCIAVIIFWTSHHTRSGIGRWLNSKWMVSLGALSYSLYLWQQLFSNSLNTSWTGQFPLNIALIFAVALLSYYAIEKPFLRLKNRFASV